MQSSRPDPSGIMALATGYWNAATLLAANEIDLFGALADAPLSAAQTANALHTDPHATRLLLDACAGLGLLTKTAPSSDAEATYANAPDSGAFLVPGRPGYLGDALRWSRDQYGAWGGLAQSVRMGGPSVPPSRHLGDDPDETRRFVIGMHNRALGVARGVIHFLDFGGVTHLLDVGGGPGTYATLLAHKYSELRVDVLDLPAVAAIAEELIAGAGLSERVKSRPGNAVKDDYGNGEYDGVLFSGVLHQMAPATIQQMLRKAKRALQSGGRVIVSDVMLDATKTQPAFAALFSLQMMLTSEHGAVFSSQECGEWLTGAGFEDVQIQPLPPPLPYVVVSARA